MDWSEKGYVCSYRGKLRRLRGLTHLEYRVWDACLHLAYEPRAHGGQHPEWIGLLVDPETGRPFSLREFAVLAELDYRSIGKPMKLFSEDDERLAVVTPASGNHPALLRVVKFRQYQHLGGVEEADQQVSPNANTEPEGVGKDEHEVSSDANTGVVKPEHGQVSSNPNTGTAEAPEMGADGMGEGVAKPEQEGVTRSTSLRSTSKKTSPPNPPTAGADGHIDLSRLDGETATAEQVARAFLHRIGYDGPPSQQTYDETLDIIEKELRDGKTMQTVIDACEVAALDGARGPRLIPHKIGKKPPESEADVSALMEADLQEKQQTVVTELADERAAFDALPKEDREKWLAAASKEPVLRSMSEDHPVLIARAVALWTGGASMRQPPEQATGGQHE